MAAEGKEVPKFIHNITGKEAEQLLLTKGLNGSFLVRFSATDPNVYTLSHRVINEVKHFKFITTEEGFEATGMPDTHPTIGDLITDLQTKMNGLDYPLWPSDPAPEGLLPRMFFGRLTSKHADLLLLDENAQPERNFIIRSSTSKYGQLVISARLENSEVVHVLVDYERVGKQMKYFAKGNQKTTYFDNMKDFVDHYTTKKNEMEDSHGRKIKLLKPMICPWNTDHSVIVTSQSVYSSVKEAKRAEEFQKLQSDGCSSGLKSDIGRRPENLKKNRYKNILPYDDTRVILKDGPDYINANYLKAGEKLGVYIACQGPLNDTIFDFWRMIWQEDCSFIVMLTNTVEGGKNKCTQYWPKDEGKEQLVEHFRIRNVQVISSKSDYTISKLILESDGKSKKVYHCHYTGWPDKSVPRNIDALIQFTADILRLRAEHQMLQRPVVAHCSAGIGRTGTYVLISMVIDVLQNTGDMPDIFHITKILRTQRPGMVQTMQQYHLVYDATDTYRSRFIGTAYGNVTSQQGGPVYGNINPRLQ